MNGSNEIEVKKAFDLSTERFQIVACWVGILLNIVWMASDLVVLPAFFLPFLFFRLSVSLATSFLLLVRKQLKISIYFCIFFLVSGIAIQNAYMWSVMDVSHFQQHSLAYVVLFIGVGMLVLWELKFSIVLAVLTILANVIFYLVFSELTVEQVMINGGFLTLTVLIFSIFLIRTRYRLTFNEIKLRLDLEKTKKEIEWQKEEVEFKNKEITDSINYAQNIQKALLPKKDQFRTSFKDALVYFQPKDIVSGDFYWIHENEKFICYATADCTGHGVPGGFMTMLGMSFLEEIVAVQGNTDPGTVLNLLRDKITTTLNQKGVDGESKDGMDISFCAIQKGQKRMDYAAAFNDIHVLRNSELISLKAYRQPCGYSPDATIFETKHIDLQENDIIYTTTDGYADQFGGAKGKKFRTKNMLSLFSEIGNADLASQEIALHEKFQSWKSDFEQVDDVLIIAVKV